MRAFYLSKSPFRRTKSALLPVHWPKGSPHPGGRGYISLFFGCHFARPTPFPPDVSCPSALCLICVPVTSAEAQQPFISASLQCFLAEWTVGAVVGKGGDGNGSPVVSLSHFRNRGSSLPLVPLEGLPMGEPQGQHSSSSPLSKPPARVRMPPGTASAMPMGLSACRPRGQDRRMDMLSLCSPGSEDLGPDPS